jgi:hypothetical protein
MKDRNEVLLKASLSRESALGLGANVMAGGVDDG